MTPKTTVAIFTMILILGLGACAGAGKNSSVLPSAGAPVGAQNNRHPRHTQSTGAEALYVANSGSNIAAFGLPSSSPEAEPTGDGNFPNIGKQPCSMAADPNTGNLYVLDCNSHTINAYSQFGYQVTLTPYGGAAPFAQPFPTQTEAPTSIAWGQPPDFPAGAAYVAWSGNNYSNALAVYYPDGTLARSLGVSGAPSSLAFDPVTNYFLYIVNNKIQEVDGNLNPVPLSSSSPAFSNVKSAAGLAVDPSNGDICALDSTGGGTLYVYDYNGTSLIGTMSASTNGIGPICENGTVYITSYTTTNGIDITSAYSDTGTAQTTPAFSPGGWSAFAYGPYASPTYGPENPTVTPGPSEATSFAVKVITTGFQLPTSPGGGLYAVAAGANNTLWFTDGGFDGRPQNVGYINDTGSQANATELLVPTATNPSVPPISPWAAPTPTCDTSAGKGGVDPGWCCNSDSIAQPCPTAFPPLDASLTDDQLPAMAYDSTTQKMWFTVPSALNITNVNPAGTIMSPIGLLPINFMSFGQDQSVSAPNDGCSTGPGTFTYGYPCVVNEETTGIAAANGIPYATVGQMGDVMCNLGWIQVDEYAQQQMQQYGPDLSPPPVGANAGPICEPGAMAFDPYGDLWVTKQLGSDYPGGYVWDVATRNAVGYSLASGSDPVAIASGPDGNMYVADKTEGAIWKITVSSGAVQEFTISASCNTPQPTDIVSDGNSLLWFTDKGCGAIGYMTTGGTSKEYATGVGTPYNLLGVTRIPDTPNQLAVVYNSTNNTWYIWLTDDFQHLVEMQI
jgi:hypothetical protein